MAAGGTGEIGTGTAIAVQAAEMGAEMMTDATGDETETSSTIDVAAADAMTEIDRTLTATGLVTEMT